MSNAIGSICIIVALSLSFLGYSNLVEGKKEQVITSIKGSWVLHVVASVFIYAGIKLMMGGWVAGEEIFIINGVPSIKNIFRFKEVVGFIFMVLSVILSVFALAGPGGLSKIITVPNAFALVILSIELMTSFGSFLPYL